MIHVVSHTHWDRAWYWTVEQSRPRLVDLIDGLLDLLERDPQYRFTLDGQAQVVLDYLAVRGDRRPALARHVRSGRLVVGPLLVLPDLFIPRAESLLRNLRLGLRESRALGAAPRVAHIPDPFGYPAQLPQLLAGCGIDGVTFARGMGNEGKKLGADFWWEAPDGSRVLATHLVGGYANLANLGLPPPKPNQPAALPRASQADLPARLRRACKQIATLAERMAGDCPHGLRLLGNGCDHLPADPAVPALLAAAEHRLEGIRLLHSDYASYQRAVRRAIAKETFTPAVHRGELRGARYAPLLPGVLSARTDLKLAHDQAERLLLRWVEPLASLARATAPPATAPGGPAGAVVGDRALIEHAWLLLLRCQPHDDICGCSVDAVHDDDLNRLARCQQLAHLLRERSLATLKRRITPAQHDQPLALNPHPWPLQSVVEHGEGLRFARVPALGFAPLDVQLPADVRPVTTARRAGLLAVENGLLRLELERGQVQLVDLRAGGRRLPRLLELLDEGDAGDSYDFSPPPTQRVIRGERPRIRVLRADPLRAEVELGYRLELPVALSRSRRRRSTERRAVAVTIVLRVEAASPVLGVEVLVDNTVDEHRLRLAVRAPLGATESLAGAPAQLIRRPLALPGARGWAQLPAPTHPFQSLIAVERPGRGGVAVLARGLREYEARRAGECTELLVTLLRSVRWLSRDDLSTRRGHAGPAALVNGARQLGATRLSLGVLPLDGPLERSDALAHARLLSDPCLVTEPGSASRAEPPASAAAALASGFLELHPRQVQLGALEPAASGNPREVDLRLINPTSAPLVARLLGPWREPRRIDLEGQPLRQADPVSLDALDLRPGQIFALRLRYQETVPDNSPTPDHLAAARM